MKVTSVVTAQTMSEESVICTAVKEDGHQKIMSSVVLKKSVEEPWTIERQCRDSWTCFGYREITLKSDTEHAIIAFRNRVAEMCKAEVAPEDAVKGDTESNELTKNTVILIRGTIRTNRCHTGSSTRSTQCRITNSAVVDGTCGLYPVQMSKKLWREDAI